LFYDHPIPIRWLLLRSRDVDQSRIHIHWVSILFSKFCSIADIPSIRMALFSILHPLSKQHIPVDQDKVCNALKKNYTSRPPFISPPSGWKENLMASDFPFIRAELLNGQIPLKRKSGALCIECTCPPVHWVLLHAHFLPLLYLNYPSKNKWNSFVFFSVQKLKRRSRWKTSSFSFRIYADGSPNRKLPQNRPGRNRKEMYT
jgi:hypothetical protein